MERLNLDNSLYLAENDLLYIAAESRANRIFVQMLLFSVFEGKAYTWRFNDQIELFCTPHLYQMQA